MPNLIMTPLSDNPMEVTAVNKLNELEFEITVSETLLGLYESYSCQFKR